jgi:glycosyltransferase involved in cell wall biosynthesis
MSMCSVTVVIATGNGFERGPRVRATRASGPNGRWHVVEAVDDVANAGAVPARVRDECETLRDAGHRVTVVTNGLPSPRVTPPGARIIRVGPRTRWLRRSAIKPLVLGWRLRDVIRQEWPDLAVVHHAVPAWIVRRVAKRTGTPVIVVVHSLVHEERRHHANPHRRPTTTLARIAERGLRRATLVAPVSQALMPALEQLGVASNQIVVIPNSVDMDRFRPGDLANPDIDVLYVGRLSPEKGPQDLLTACTRFSAGTRVTIAGSGRMRAELERMAALAACQVEFTGFVSDDALPALYQRTRLVVMPSRTEAQPRVALEAMASGVPIVATRVGGLVELVDHGSTGWLVEPADVDGLAQAIAHALAVDLGPMGRAARARAEAFGRAAFDPQLIEAAERAIATTNR